MDDHTTLLEREVAPEVPGRSPVDPLGQERALDAERLEGGHLLRLGREPRQAGMIKHIVEREQAPHQHFPGGDPAAAAVPGAERPVDAAKFRPLGIPCLRDRVAQTSAMLVLGPIFEADLQPEQYAYRPGRSAKDAVQRIRGLLYRGHNEVVDADLSNYFGEIPHAELMKSIARRVSDGRMLGLIKAWLEMPVIEEDGKGGTRRTNRARKERKGTPQGAPISPLLSSIYMRRFILGWKVLGYARRFGAEIVNYADDFCVLGKASTAEMLAAVNRLMDRLKLPVNAEKTRCLRCPEEPLEFLGYRIGWNYRSGNGSRYIGTRPSKASVQSICHRISEQTDCRREWLDAEEVVGRLNRMMLGWANYFNLGQVNPAYRAVDQHAAWRLRQWYCRKHKGRSGKYVRFPYTWLWEQCGLTCLARTTRYLPWAKA